MNHRTPCERIANANEWCGFTYTLFRSGIQDIGPQARIFAGDHLESHYIYDDSTGNYTQNLVQNRNVVETLSTNDGVAQGFGTAEECAATDCGTVPAHRCINTIITMDSPDPDYGKTQAQAPGVTTSGFGTSDGGKTWAVDRISIPQFTFT
ncbi:hypothetical protein CLAFUR4_08468 [Fulvia fulva]|nr:hypothetical protein CLAFUR4_08468 [Fulvia fulva]KAK4630427.1 hypothetical protein CLAFUR0_08463 [Fulvia fulva]WPV27247.1 hypothetical protein CLAFUW7_08463 [Fulvia fulva]